MTLGIAAGHVQGSARLYKLQRIVFELTTTTRSSKHTLRIEAVLLPFNRAAIMLAVKMPKPAMQLFAVGVLALLSVAAAQALVPGPAPPMMRQVCTTVVTHVVLVRITTVLQLVLALISFCCYCSQTAVTAESQQALR